MPILLYPKCWRDRTDCEPIHCVDGVSKQLSEEDMMTLNYTPDSFVCSGVVIGTRTIEQDLYRLCFKNECTDEISDNDMQDLSSIIAVAAAAVNLDAVRKVSNGIVELPAEQNKPKDNDNES